MLATVVVTIVGLAATLAASPVAARSTRSARAGSSRTHWVKLGVTGAAQYYEPGMYRTADGVLHVLYTSARSDGAALVHVSISPAGNVLHRNTVISGWHDITWYPALTAGSNGGLRAVFSGSTLQLGFWQDAGIYTATGNMQGTSWTLPTDRFGPDAGSNRLTATTLASGTPIEAYTQHVVGGPTPGGYLSVHTGLGTSPADEYRPLGNPDGPALVRDGHKVYAAWRNVGETKLGVWVKQVAPSVGPAVRAPRSLTADGITGSDQSIAMAASSRGGTWLLYCQGKEFSCPRLVLWKVGTHTTYQVPQSAGADFAALSAGPGGRLWLAWREGSQTYAVRTAPNGHTFGVVRHVSDAGLDCCQRKLQIEGSRGPLDLFTNTFNKPWHRQIDPGLVLKASPRRWSAGTRTTVTFTVRDAGTLVAHATVRQGSQSCSTNSHGQCRITFVAGSRRTLTAVASKAHYYRGKVTLQAR